MHRLVYKIESQQIVKSLYITIEPQKLVRLKEFREPSAVSVCKWNEEL